MFPVLPVFPVFLGKKRRKIWQKKLFDKNGHFLSTFPDFFFAQFFVLPYFSFFSQILEFEAFQIFRPLLIFQKLEMFPVFFLFFLFFLEKKKTENLGKSCSMTRGEVRGAWSGVRSSMVSVFSDTAVRPAASKTDTMTVIILARPSVDSCTVGVRHAPDCPPYTS